MKKENINKIKKLLQKAFLLFEYDETNWDIKQARIEIVSSNSRLCDYENALKAAVKKKTRTMQMQIEAVKCYAARQGVRT